MRIVAGKSLVAESACDAELSTATVALSSAYAHWMYMYICWSTDNCSCCTNSRWCSHRSMELGARAPPPPGSLLSYSK